MHFPIEICQGQPLLRYFATNTAISVAYCFAALYAVAAHSADGNMPPSPLFTANNPAEFNERVKPKREPKHIRILSSFITGAPTIDGQANEASWDAATPIITLDFASQREITLKTVHNQDEIFFLVTFPEAAPSVTHKSWGWNAEESIYRRLADREDMFVIKWSMVGNNIDLSFRDAKPHRADIWYWKAHRTDPSGYADDKWQALSATPHAKAQQIPSSQETLYLQRVGDSGRSAYEERLVFEHQGDTAPRYKAREPQGSRADVRAKGLWRNGVWTIEFARKLDTGHKDDLAMTPGGLYLFGVSRYEIAYGEVNPNWAEPLFKSGDVFDQLMLHIERR